MYNDSVNAPTLIMLHIIVKVSAMLPLNSYAFATIPIPVLMAIAPSKI